MIEEMTRSVLNVGGNSKAIALPPQYAGFEHLLLDIDPTGQPDVVCDARQLTTLESASFDAVYCSHNLEHYLGHEVARVLEGFRHVLKPGGFAHIRVPDMLAVMRQAVERGLDLEDTLYQSAIGPIRVIDVIYGHGPQIEASGHDFFAHKTGFSRQSLHAALLRAGFPLVYSGTGNLEVTAIAFSGRPDPADLARFNLQPT